MDLVVQMVQILVSGLTEMAAGIGTGLNELVVNIFLASVDGATTLSTFGSVILAFGGIALAIGLSRFVVNWVTSFGR